jgi:K+-sensing histidine kinase KdpD
MLRYGVALCVTALAAGLRGVLGAPFPGLVPFATFFPAILIVTLLAGLGPGLLSTALSAFVAWFFWLQATAELAPPTAAAALNLALFVFASLVSVATAEAARRYMSAPLRASDAFAPPRILPSMALASSRRCARRMAPSAISGGPTSIRRWPRCCTAPATI